MKNSKDIKKIKGINTQITELSKLGEQMNIVPEYIRTMIENQNRLLSSLSKIEIPKYNFPKFEIPEHLNLKSNVPDFNIPKFEFFNSKLLESFRQFSKIGEKIRSNPEIQFAEITDLEILNLKSAEEFKESLVNDLTDEDIKEKEELLNDHLIPYLEELGIESLWIGANDVLESKSNPDKLRHCLISLRTILEHLIEDKLAPTKKLKNDPKFEKNFKQYHLGKQKIEFVKN
jgi:hypothetical protein